MGYTPIVSAEPAFANDGVPYSAAFDDIYHSASGGLDQARHVFLAGNELIGSSSHEPRWCRRERFVVLETGFGAGLNFLVTWQAWRADPERPARLHYVSVEKHPFHAAHIAGLYAKYPELVPLAETLAAQWPPLLPGLHRLHFDQGAVTLTLAFGDVAEQLPQLALAADAIYLDGFAPAKNPEMWSDAIFAQLARLAAPGGTLATWSVHDDMMFRLARAGFRLEKRPGFGTKRYMLTATRPGEPTAPAARARSVAIVGAGIAGSSAAQRLRAHGFEVAVFERAASPAQGASGNLAGVFRPLPSQDDSRLSRLLRACFLYGRRHLLSQPAARFDLCGVLHIARDAKHEDTQRRIVAEQAPPADFLRFVDREEAAQLAGWPVDMGGWWFPGGGWINPPSLCRANLDDIATHCAAAIERIEEAGNGWRLVAEDGADLGTFGHVVLANAVDARRLVPSLAVRSGRGQVSHLPASTVPCFGIVATRLGYVAPAVDGLVCAGATLAPDDADMSLRLSDHIENLTRLDMTLPGYAAGLDPAALDGRVGFRPMSPDRLPMVGALDRPGLWTLNGFGARGLVWAALCAELLAAQMDDAPLPVEADLAAALAPLRFTARPRRRAKV